MFKAIKGFNVNLVERSCGFKSELSLDEKASPKFSSFVYCIYLCLILYMIATQCVRFDIFNYCFKVKLLEADDAALLAVVAVLGLSLIRLLLAEIPLLLLPSIALPKLELLLIDPILLLLLSVVVVCNGRKLLVA